MNRRALIFVVSCVVANFALVANSRGDFVLGAADVPGTGVFQLDIVGFGVVGSIAPGTAIPRNPGTLGLLSGGAFGTTTGFLATTWDFTPTNASVFIPNSPPAASTTFLSQTIPSPLPGPEPGLATFRSDFEATFSLDAGGLAAQSIGIAYGLTMIVDGLVNFDAVIDYTSSTEGALDTLAIHFSRATPGGYFTIVSDSGSLPALPGLSTLTLSGYFQLQVDDKPGGSSTEIDVRNVPEPGGLALASLGILSCLCFWRRR